VGHPASCFIHVQGIPALVWESNGVGKTVFTRAAPVHSVHVYDDDSSLIARLAAITSSGLRVGDAVVVIATPQHREQLIGRLRAQGIEVPEYAPPGRFRMFDAAEVGSLWMERGWFDRQRFLRGMHRILQDAEKVSGSTDHGVTVFGEVVSILWDQGARAAAIELEMLWNDLLSQHAFHLHCAYPRAGLILGEVGEVAAVCDLHAHVLMDSCVLAG
jgi:hypothetical protein